VEVSDGETATVHQTIYGRNDSAGEIVWPTSDGGRPLVGLAA